MPDESIQCHADASTCDSISSVTVPIVFVPGVMGSRLDIIAGRNWDPDSPNTEMSTWLSLTNTGRQTTRRALRAAGRGAPGTPAIVKSDLPWDYSNSPTTQVYSNDRCRKIGARQVGDDKSDIGNYYGRLRNWGSVSWGFYGALLIFLESQLNHEDEPQFPVYACGYDWRQSNTVSGLKINDFIRQVVGRHSPSASDVIVVTHSMGGLAVRAGIGVDNSINQKIRGVIHGLQPSLGAVTCYRRFLTGASAPVDNDSGQDYFLNRIMGTTGPHYAYNLSGCPGPLQLLPNHLYSSAAGTWLQGLDSSQDLGAIYGIYRQGGLPGIAGIVATGEDQFGTIEDKKAHSVRADFAANLTAAENLHKALEHTAHPSTYVLYSTGLRTDHSITFNNLSGTISDGEPPPQPWAVEGVGGLDLHDLSSDIVYHKLPTGDGTVPEESAKCPALSSASFAAPVAAAQALEHSKAYADPAFQALTLSFVQRLLTPTPP